MHTATTISILTNDAWRVKGITLALRKSGVTAAPYFRPEIRGQSGVYHSPGKRRAVLAAAGTQYNLDRRKMHLSVKTISHLKINVARKIGAARSNDVVLLRYMHRFHSSIHTLSILNT